MTFKQAEGKWKGVDQTVTLSEIRTWAFCFVKHGVLPSPVQIYSHQLPIEASFEVSQISQDMWIYGIHSSSLCWDKAAWSRLGCTDAESLQKISQIPIPQKPPGSKHFLMPLAPKEKLFPLFLIAPLSGMQVNVPLSCSTVIYMIFTSVPGFLTEDCSENRMIPTSFPHCLLTPFPAKATAVQGSLAVAWRHPRRAWSVDFAFPFGLPWMLVPLASHNWGVARIWVDGISFHWKMWVPIHTSCEQETY